MSATTENDFTQATILQLQKRAGNHCSKPDCCCVTTGPNEEQKKSTSIGVASHIKARSPGGPRFDPNQTPEQRRSIENGIWLCQNHAREIDVNPDAYGSELLFRWRSAREAWATEQLGRPRPEEQPARPQSGWECPFCQTPTPTGARVCLGCDADIVYGLTQKQRSDVVKAALMGGGLVGAILMIVLPTWVHDFFLNYLRLKVAAGWGLGIFALIPIGVLAIFTVYYFVNREEAKARAKPPTYVRRTS
ncbi:hypothetical protein [Roseateles oligotrophus]|uniref:HNH endonuclease n=1 Tax=Roseateles oligotrophus TaxID=1769250 RepID=A0ABT2YJ72_9BURK|nr:hypothetical protein [Roseateles oligotrophus]MCV2370006.1 hypothetical protein [Roseateles oligotrophus]